MEEAPPTMSLADFFAPVFENKSGYEQVMDETVGKPVYLIERYEINKGIFQHIQGHPYPQKGIPPQADALFAANQVKKLILESVTLMGWRMLTIRRHKLIKAYNQIAYKILSPYLIKYPYLTNTAQGVYDFTTEFLVHYGINRGKAQRTAHSIAMIVELDSAYRFRLIDLASETNAERLTHAPIKEIRRLMKIHQQRDYASQHTKFKTIGTLITLALMVPKFRKAWKQTLREMDWNKLTYDEADRYWAKHKKDYNYFGLTYAERQEQLHRN